MWLFTLIPLEVTQYGYSETTFDLLRVALWVLCVIINARIYQRPRNTNAL